MEFSAKNADIKLNCIMIIIRPAQLSDAASIGKVHLETDKYAHQGILPDFELTSALYQSAAESKRRKLLETRLGKTSFFVAELENGQIVGFSQGGPTREGHGEQDAELYNLFVLPAYQKRQIGNALFYALIHTLIKKGYHSLCLSVFKTAQAVNYYQKLGAVLLDERHEILAEHAVTLEVYGWSDITRLIHELSQALEQADEDFDFIWTPQ